MKKLIFTLAVAMFATLSLSAQETAKKCTKAEASKCCAKKTAQAESSVSADFSEAMAYSMKDQNVSKRECAETGAVSYFQKNVCETSGKISYQEVEFDTAKRQFVNKSPNDIGDANQADVIKVVNMDKTADTSAKTTKASCSKTSSGAKCCSAKNKKVEGSN